MKTKELLVFLNDMFGNNLKQEYKENILAYIESPNFLLWDEIHCYIISTGMTCTVWQNLLEVDPTFPRTGRSYGEQMRITKEWERIPSSEDMIEVIKLAAQKNMTKNLN